MTNRYEVFNRNFSNIDEKVHYLYSQDNDHPAIDMLVLFKMFLGLLLRHSFRAPTGTRSLNRLFLGLCLTEHVPYLTTAVDANRVNHREKKQEGNEDKGVKVGATDLETEYTFRESKQVSFIYLEAPGYAFVSELLPLQIHSGNPGTIAI